MSHINKINKTIALILASLFCANYVLAAQTQKPTEEAAANSQKSLKPRF